MGEASKESDEFMTKLNRDELIDIARQACESDPVQVEFVALVDTPTEASILTDFPSLLDTDPQQVVVYRWQTGFGYAYGVVGMFATSKPDETREALQRKIYWNMPHMKNGKLWTP